MSTFSFILGDWSRNIGNAFFQLGGFHVLKTICPEASFSLIAEQPGYPSYWNPKGGNPRNYFNMVAAVKSDYLVLMGPMFRPETSSIWAESLERKMKEGTKLILLGVAAMKYGEEDIQLYREFLKRFPPYILTSRDRDTFAALGDLAEHSYDGIDFAFFIPNYYPLAGLENVSPYVAMSFDKSPEPELNICPIGEEVRDGGSYDSFFEFQGHTWLIRTPGLRTRLARMSRYLMMIEGVLFHGPSVDHIGPYAIIRTDHRPHPMIGRKTFRSPNTMVNDTPFPYFEVYGNSQLTLSNRLHACVIALSYGRPAMLFSQTPRLRLIERSQSVRHYK